jgi:hypothetical protein
LAPDSRTPKSWYVHGFSILTLVSRVSRCTFRPDPVGDGSGVRSRIAVPSKRRFSARSRATASRFASSLNACFLRLPSSVRQMSR